MSPFTRKHHPAHNSRWTPHWIFSCWKNYWRSLHLGVWLRLKFWRFCDCFFRMFTRHVMGNMILWKLRCMFKSMIINHCQKLNDKMMTNICDSLVITILHRRFLQATRAFDLFLRRLALTDRGMGWSRGSRGWGAHGEWHGEWLVFLWWWIHLEKKWHLWNILEPEVT